MIIDIKLNFESDRAFIERERLEKVIAIGLINRGSGKEDLTLILKQNFSEVDKEESVIHSKSKINVYETVMKNVDNTYFNDCVFGNSLSEEALFLLITRHYTIGTIHIIETDESPSCYSLAYLNMSIVGTEFESEADELDEDISIKTYPIMLLRDYEEIVEETAEDASIQIIEAWKEKTHTIDEIFEIIKPINLTMADMLRAHELTMIYVDNYREEEYEDEINE